MKNAVIVTNISKDTDCSVTLAVAKRLMENGILPYISASLGIAALDGAQFYDSIPENAELIVAVGGDGTVIDASRYAVSLGIPLVAVNLGTLGYLAEVEPTDLALLDRLASGEYKIESKMLLAVEKDGTHYDTLAVNDIVISHYDYLGISSLRVSDSLGNTLSYRADGVIISTPQGSTAYSLSSGGPIVAHDVDSMLLSPVCPHSFFNRSVLFSAGERLSVTNTGNADMNVSVDGRRLLTLLPGETCKVSVSTRKFDMISFSENSMFRNLFKKMRILEDID